MNAFRRSWETVRLAAASPERPYRRGFLSATAAAAALLFLRPRNTGAADPSGAALRDEAISAMRAADVTPPWFTSENWNNRQYGPWTDYIAGKISETEFSRVCA